MDQPIENDSLQSSPVCVEDHEDTQSEAPPAGVTFIYPTSDLNDLPGECKVQDANNPGTHALDTDLTAETPNANVPTIPSFVTVAEKFADEFWTSATTTHTATASSFTTSHAESPTDPFEFVPSPDRIEDSGSKSTGDLITEHHETASTTAHPCSDDMVNYSSAEGEVGACALDGEQIGQGLPPVLSDTAWGPSYLLPTPESLALANQSTPAQEEVDAAWPAPSNDSTNAADTWGVGITAVPDTNSGDAWGTDSKPTAVGNEAKGDNANNGWSGGEGWKTDKTRTDNQGYGRGGFRRDRPFWQPPESDSGWDGFRKRSGFRGCRRDYQDSGGGHNDNGPWESPLNDKAHNTNTTDRNATEPAWGGATYSTTNNPTWDAPPAKNVEASWGLAPESKIEKPRPEEKKLWALPKAGNAWDALPPPSNGGNPYRPVGTPKGADGSLTPSATARDGTSRAVGGDTGWGTGARTKKVLDSKQTEGMVRRVLGEHTRRDTPRLRTQGIQPPQVEEPPEEEDGGDEEGDLTPPPTTPMTPTGHARRSAPYSYVSSRSRRAGSPTLTATTLDTGYISSGTTTTTTRRKLVASGLPPVRRARSRAGSVVRQTRIVYEDGLEDDDEGEYEYIYEDARQPLARGREVIPRPSVPAKQGVVYQQAHPQYVYVYDGEEEYEDGEFYYTPAPPPDAPTLVRRLAPAPAPAAPKSMSFRVPNTTTDVTITLNEAAPPPPPLRHARARPRPAERVVYVSSEPARRVRTAAPRIYEVDDDGYTIAGDDEYDEVPVIAKPVPKGRVYMRE